MRERKQFRSVLFGRFLSGQRLLTGALVFMGIAVLCGPLARYPFGIPVISRTMDDDQKDDALDTGEDDGETSTATGDDE